MQRIVDRRSELRAARRDRPISETAVACRLERPAMRRSEFVICWTLAILVGKGRFSSASVVKWLDSLDLARRKYLQRGLIAAPPVELQMDDSFRFAKVIYCRAFPFGSRLDGDTRWRRCRRGAYATRLERNALAAGRQRTPEGKTVHRIQFARILRQDRIR